MKIILRIITLPVAWILWTIHYSYHWVIHGGELSINDKPVISPKEFHRLLTEVVDKVNELSCDLEYVSKQLDKANFNLKERETIGTSINNNEIDTYTKQGLTYV